MTNDVKNICQKDWSYPDKKMELSLLVEDYVHMIKKLIWKYPNLKIFISMVLSRFDGLDKLAISNGNDFVNVEISKQLCRENHVILMSNDHLKESAFDHKKFHLTKAGFDIMCKKWRSEIDNIFS